MTLKNYQYICMRIFIYIFGVVSIFTSCNNSHQRSSEDESYYNYEENSGYEEYEDSNYEIELNEEKQDKGFEDGIYSATVDYYNPETGYSATYALDVEVEDNQVTVIYFPNGGYLDNGHIWIDELDEDGFVNIEGEEGKTYEVQIHF